MQRLLLCIATLVLITAAPSARISAQRALVVVANTPGLTQALLDGGVCVVRDLGSWLLAFTEPGEIERLRRGGVALRVVDEKASPSGYYLVATGSRPGREYLEREHGAIALDEWTSVVAMTPQRAGEVLAGWEIARVFETPMRAPAAGTATSMAPSAQVEVDTLVSAMVDSVSGSRIDAQVASLQAFGTRHAWADSGLAAAQYVLVQFQQAGIDSVRLQQWDARYNPNVIAVLPGIGRPDEIVVLGGHYDSASRSPADPAPGADDNASGTSGLIECARILSGYQFERTIVLAAFGAEEIGLLGSEAFVAGAVARGDSIEAMINLDMIGYVRAGDTVDIDLIFNTSSQWLRDLVRQVGDVYVPAFRVVDGTLPVAFNSDHASFWRHGYDAVYFFEDSDAYSPFMHSAQDVVGLSYQAPGLALNSVRLALASVAVLATPWRDEPPQEPPPARGPLSIAQNFPNPFNPGTTIRVNVPGRTLRVTLKIYDVAGRVITTLLSDERVTGEREVQWDGRDRSGVAVASGIYFYQVTTAEGRVSRKMVVVR